MTAATASALASLGGGGGAIVGPSSAAPFDPLSMPPHSVEETPEDLAAAISLTAGAAEHALRFEGLKKTIGEFYAAVAPDRLAKVGDVCTKYLGSELRLFAQLETKYRYGATSGRQRAGPVDRSVPVYPYGYLQKEFNKNITAAAIAHACRDQLVANKVREQRLVANSRAKAAGAAAGSASPPPPAPKQKSRDAIAREVEATVAAMPTDAQVAELVRLSTAPLERSGGAPAPSSLYGLTVWADVAVRTHSLARAEAEWDMRVTEYLKGRAAEVAEVSLGGAGDASVSGAYAPSLMGRTVSTANSAIGAPSQSGGDVLLLASAAGGDVAAADADAPPPTLRQSSDAQLWQLIHQHHQRVRRSLFIGEAAMDELLPTGEPTVRAASNAPVSVPSTVLRASIASGYASTCDVTYRQQVQALCARYCPQHLPLVLPALWLYRGREHELIAKLHAEHGLDKPPPPTSQPEGADAAEGAPKKPPPKGGRALTPATAAGSAISDFTADGGYLSTEPNPLNTFPDPLVGSEIYLADAMHGSVCGLGREVAFDTRLKLLKGAVGSANADADANGGALTAALPMAYPCEDASFRSWSNVPPQLHAAAHMARHFGLGPQFIHQLHAQNPLDPDAACYELLCALFPDAVYFCLDDDEQRVAFMARRVSELMSFVRVCDPLYTRPHRGLPEGDLREKENEKDDDGNDDEDTSQSRLVEAIPRLFQKYSGLRGVPTDEAHEAQAARDAIAADNASKYTRKPSKAFGGRSADPFADLMGDDDDFGDDGGRDGYRNRPERALADAFAQHFGQQLSTAVQPAFPWEDMYKHVNAERHSQVLASCQRWAAAYGPLPALNAIQLDIIGTAAATVVQRNSAASQPANSDDEEDGGEEGRGGASTSALLSVGAGGGGVGVIGRVDSANSKKGSNGGGLRYVPNDFEESSGTTRRVPTSLSDPRNPLALLVTSSAIAMPAATAGVGADDATEGQKKPRAKTSLTGTDLTPSLLHQMACQQLTRSTPTVHDSITKGWLRSTAEVGTMTRHREEEALAKILGMTSVGTCTAEDGDGDSGIDLSDDKYRGWPMPFRYEEEYRQAVRKMPLAQLRRERHRALFGGRADPGVVMFGNKGKPMPLREGTRGHRHQSHHHDDPYGHGGGGSTYEHGGVRFAADGTIDLSSPSPSRSPRRPHHNSGGRAQRSRSSPPTASDAVAAMYRFDKDYALWFEETVGEAGRGRFDYKRHIDPDTAARLKHKALYFGAQPSAKALGLAESDNEGDAGRGAGAGTYGPYGGAYEDGGGGDSSSASDSQEDLMDAVFGEGAGGARGGKGTSVAKHGKGRAPPPMGPNHAALAAASGVRRSPFWFDGPLADYADESDEWLAARTSGDGVARLIGRYRKGQAMLDGAAAEISRLRAEVEALRNGAGVKVGNVGDVSGGSLLTVPRLHGSGGYSSATAAPQITVYPKSFATAVAERDRRMAEGGSYSSASPPQCGQCEALQSKVNGLMNRLAELRNAGAAAKAYGVAGGSAVPTTATARSDRQRGAHPSPSSARRPLPRASSEDGLSLDDLLSGEEDTSATYGARLAFADGSAEGSATAAAGTGLAKGTKAASAAGRRRFISPEAIERTPTAGRRGHSKAPHREASPPLTEEDLLAIL